MEGVLRRFGDVLCYEYGWPKGEREKEGGSRVCMECTLQRGLGSYMRSSLPLLPLLSEEEEEGEDEFVWAALTNRQSSLRHTLHVQSISSWAPVCVGPYSQSHTLRGCLTFLSGQIGLDRPSMTLVGGSSHSANEKCSSDKDERRGGGGKNEKGERKFASSSWEDELGMSWRNAVSVLDMQPGGGGTLDDCLEGVVYLSSAELREGGNEGRASSGIDWSERAGWQWIPTEGLRWGRWTEREVWGQEGLEESEGKRKMPRTSAEEARERRGNRSEGKRTRVRGGR